MKDLSVLEKEIIDKIIEIDEKQGLNILSNLLARRFSDFSYYIQMYESNPSSINITEEHIEQIGRSIGGLDRIRYIIEQSSKDVYIAIKLLEYLEKEGLIYTVGNLKLDTIGSRIIDGKYVSYSGFAKEIEDLLRIYIGKQIIPTQGLIAARDRGFMSEEEFRFQKTARWTRLTLILSAFAVAVSAVSVIISSIGVTETKILNFPDSLAVDVKERKADSFILSSEVRIVKSLDSVSDQISNNSASMQKELGAISADLKSLSAILSAISRNTEPSKALGPMTMPVTDTAAQPPRQQ